VDPDASTLGALDGSADATRFTPPPGDDAETCLSPGADCPGVPPRECPDGGTTWLTGTVFDPAGTTPVANAVVYVPENSLAAIPHGSRTTCNGCEILIEPTLVSTVAEADGTFALPEVPVGKDIPLVIQVGRWRREIFIPNVELCGRNPLPAALTRLPRDQTEGDLPQMAVVTGACDGVACFLRRVGVDASEFTGPDKSGRVHVYQGVGGPALAGGGGGAAGDCTGSSGACPLWGTAAQLARYDQVLLGCECSANDQTKPDKSILHDWLDLGGTAIAVHSQETWFENGPSEFQTVVQWDSSGTAPGPYVIDPLRSSLLLWATAAGIHGSNGAIALNPADVTVSMVGASTANALRWIYDDDGDGGRAVLTDVHVGAGPAGPSTDPVPESCAIGPLSAEEKALEYQLFDEPIPCVENALPPLGDLPPIGK
jgi:hypothetical protein